VTSFYFSVLYYGIEVWHHKQLGFHLKQKIRSCHYRALGVICGNLTRSDLNAISERAPPEDYADFSIAKIIAKIIIVGSPSRLHDSIRENGYTE
jgi:hypothetical protein